MTHLPSVQLATEPADHPHVFARAFNTFDPDLLDQVYEPDATLAPRPGFPVTGQVRKEANGALLSLRVPITVSVRHCYASGELALLIVDWALDGRASDGARVHLSATATDVARRGADGRWRYVLDNPFGTAAGDIEAAESAG